MRAEQEFIPASLSEIKPFSKLESQLAALREANDKAVFDYADPKGNKEARSHVHGLRKFRGELERTRKAAKQDALDYGRMIDAEAKRIDGALDAMIEVHEKPLLEIEAKETARKTAIMSRIEVLEVYKQIPPDANSEVWALELDAVTSFSVDASLAEYMAMAAICRDAAIAFIRPKLEGAIKREAEAAELTRLREEEALRIRQEREAKIAQEAAERATREAEAKAERERQIAAQEQQRKDQEAANAAKRQQEAIERAESEAKEAVERAARAEKEAKAKAEKALADKLEGERLAAEKRERDKKHQAKINNEAMEALKALGLSEDHARAAVVAIAKHEITHVTIFY